MELDLLPPGYVSRQLLLGAREVSFVGDEEAPEEAAARLVVIGFPKAVSVIVCVCEKERREGEGGGKG